MMTPLLLRLLRSDRFVARVVERAATGIADDSRRGGDLPLAATVARRQSRPLYQSSGPTRQPEHRRSELPNGPRKILLRNGYLYGRYLPSGHLLYMKDRTLFAAPFDLDRLDWPARQCRRWRGSRRCRDGRPVCRGG